MFIAVDDDGACGIGNTLEEAHNELKLYGTADQDFLVFYEATRIEVEFKVVKKTKPTQVRK